MTQKNTEKIPDELIEAYQILKELYPDADINIGMDLSIGDHKLKGDPRIDVIIDINNVDEYGKIKRKVRRIVREHETGTQMFLTRIKRKRQYGD